MAQSTPENCTFSPRISKKGKDMAKQIGGGAKRFDELYNAAEQLRKKKEEKAKQIEKEEMPTFNPRLIAKQPSYMDSVVGVSRHDALFQDADKLKSKKEVIREKYELEGCTFTPEITPMAEKIKYNSETALIQHLMVNVKKSREDLEKVKIALELRDCTFTPDISKPKRRSKSAERSRPSPAGNYNSYLSMSTI